MLVELELKEREIIQNKDIYEAWIKQAKNYFYEIIQHRLNMIKKKWKNLTIFHAIPGLPATNNPIENYYTSSLKTHRKKQLRTDEGILNQMKLSAMKRAGMLNEPKTTLCELFMCFKPFIKVLAVL